MLCLKASLFPSLLLLCCSSCKLVKKHEEPQLLSWERKSILPIKRDTKRLEFLRNLFFYLNLICSREVLIHLPASSVANESPAQFYRAGHLLRCWLMHHVYLQGNAQKELNVMVEPTWIRKHTDRGNWNLSVTWIFLQRSIKQLN